MPNVTPLYIKPLADTDFDQWLALWQGYQTFYGANIEVDTTRTTWTRFLDPAEPMFGALAMHGDRATGLVHWIFHRSCWTATDYCYLQDLFVDTEYRGGGIGRKLIESVHLRAAERQCSRVWWLTHETNADARKLYDRIASRSGFIQYRQMLA